MRNILFSIILASCSLSLQAQNFSGSGTIEDPYQVSDIYDLKVLSDSSFLWSKYFILTNDIDASITKIWNIEGSDTLGFSPIGNNETPFSGSFNGNGYTISNVYINRTTSDGISLFGSNSNSTIKNLSLINAEISGNSYVGGIIGVSVNSNISDCYVSGHINGTTFVGGLIGSSSYSIHSNCAVNAIVTGDMAGGIFGSSVNSSTENSLMIGEVYGNLLSGGFLSVCQSSEIINSYSAGKVSGSGYSGGFVGQNINSELMNCFFDTVTTNQINACYYDDYNQVVTGLSSEDFGDETIFTNAGWDLQNVWEIDSVSLQDSVKRPFIKMLLYDYPVTIDVVVAPQSYVTGSGWYNLNDTVCLNTGTSSDYNFLGWKFGNDSLIVQNPYLFVCSGGVYCIASFKFNFDGNGTMDDPFQIETYDQLKRLSLHSSLWDKHFVLLDNIDADSSRYENITGNDTMGFYPIGNSETPFSGTFKGMGHTIKNLYINRSYEDYIGLFGKTEGATIASLGVLEASISGAQYVGMLVGYAGVGTTINESYASGNIHGESIVGGFVGSNTSSEIRNCFSSVEVLGSSVAGGFAGLNSTNAEIVNCYSTSAVNATSIYGGMVGENNSSSVIDCLFDTLTSGQVIAIGVDDNEQEISKWSSDDFASDSIFVAADWDFTYVWEIRVDTSVDTCMRPYLYVFGYDYIVTIDVITAKEDRVTGGGWYNKSDTVILKAQPSPYYVFENWRIEDSIISASSNFEFICTGDSKFTAFFAYDFAGGDGTVNDPYQIETLKHLRTLSEVRDLWDDNFMLIADIDASDTRNWNISGNVALGFSPIGYKFQIDDYSTMFTGTFNGNGHKISGLYINRENSKNVGLFGAAGYSEIFDLGLIDVDISGFSMVAGIVGYQEYSNISGCMVTGKIKGADYSAGGIVANNGYYCLIKNCYSLVNVSALSYVGGIVGDLSGGNYGSSVKMSNCYAGGWIKGDTITGALIGRNYEDAGVENCFYDNTTSYQTTGTGNGIDYGVSMPTSYFSDTSNFTGWDWDSTWQIAYGYDKYKRPCLLWEKVVNLKFICRGQGYIDGELNQQIIKGCSSDTVIAKAKRGFKFIGWELNDSIISKKHLLVLDSVKRNNLVTAVFKRNMCSVHIGIHDADSVIPNAFVRLNSVDYQVDSNGIVEFQLDSGEYYFIVFADGYLSSSFNINVTADIEENVVLVRSEEKVYDILFSIHDIDGGIPNAEVKFNKQKYVADSSGEMNILNVKAGKYYFEVSATGYQGSEDSLLVSDTNLTMSITLEKLDIQPYYSVIFHVIDGQKSINHTSVDFNGYIFNTDTTGTVIIDSVLSGMYEYTISANGYIEKTDTLVIENEDVIVEVILQKTSIYENSYSSVVKIFPNPATDQIEIHLDGLSEEIKIEIYDMLGGLVYSNQILNENNLIIDTDNFIKGLYLIGVSDCRGIKYTEKIIVR